jgi:microcystin-dependent protein
MADPFLSEIRIVSFNYAPQGWAFCNGQFLPINQNQALFSLLGTTYGGNGQTTFALPDLRGRVPIHFGNGFNLGQVGGEQAHTLSINELPAHTHNVNAAAPANSGSNVNNPSGNFLSNSAPAEIYHSGAGAPGVSTLVAGTIANTGGSQAHLNMQPFLTLTFMIALQGIFPSSS